MWSRGEMLHFIVNDINQIKEAKEYVYSTWPHTNPENEPLNAFDIRKKRKPNPFKKPKGKKGKVADDEKVADDDVSV